MSGYDAVIVGANLSGSTAATLLARQGLRVALVEKSPDPAHYKHLCTHEVVGLATPVLDRLGVLDALRGLQGTHRAPRIWTTHGWIDALPEAGRTLEEGLNVRREVLDPMLRELAAETPGVDLHLGATVTDVLKDGTGRPAGVQVREGRVQREIRARIVVGADGANSVVAKGAGVPARRLPHDRFGYAAYFEGVRFDRGPAVSARMWLLDPDVAYAFPTDGGLTLVAVAPRKTPERVAEFKADLDGAFRGMHAALPDALDLSEARLVGKYVGTLGGRNSWRPASAPGVAFVGDAAQVTDFVWGTGCGFAIASGSWLADAVGPVLVARGSDADVDRGLRRYRRKHVRRLAPHYLMTSEYANGRPLSPFEHALYGAGVRDQRVARAIHTVGGRTENPLRSISPSVLLRVAAAAARGAGAPPAPRVAAPAPAAPAHV